MAAKADRWERGIGQAVLEDREIGWPMLEAPGLIADDAVLDAVIVHSALKDGQVSGRSAPVSAVSTTSRGGPCVTHSMIRAVLSTPIPHAAITGARRQAMSRGPGITRPSPGCARTRPAAGS